MRMKSFSSLATEEADDQFRDVTRLLNRVEEISRRAIKLPSELPIQADKE
jgi:hypothetical protein